MGRLPILDAPLLRVFGDGADPITAVEARAREAFPDARFIVWEGDPETFAFSYVGGDAEAILGHPARLWVDELTFWAAGMDACWPPPFCAGLAAET